MAILLRGIQVIPEFYSRTGIRTIYVNVGDTFEVFEVDNSYKEGAAAIIVKMRRGKNAFKKSNYKTRNKEKTWRQKQE